MSFPNYLLYLCVGFSKASTRKLGSLCIVAPLLICYFYYVFLNNFAFAGSLFTMLPPYVFTLTFPVLLSKISKFYDHTLSQVTCRNCTRWGPQQCSLWHVDHRNRNRTYSYLLAVSCYPANVLATETSYHLHPLNVHSSQ